MPRATTKPKRIRPMKAETVLDWATVKWPKMASPKIDGIRCVIIDGVATSQKLLPIPNRFIRNALAGLPMLDGELVVASATAKNGFDNSQSGIMSEDGEPDWYYFVFDMIDEEHHAFDRQKHLKHLLSSQKSIKRIRIVPQIRVHSLEEFEMLEASWLKKGYEGAMLRDPYSPYKYGRSTMKENYLLKVVRRHRAEVTIVGFVERQHNTNTQERDELGYSKRSKKKAGLVGTGMLGALQVKWVTPPPGFKQKAKGFNFQPYDFEVGTGFTDAQRKEIWKNRIRYHKAIGTIEYREITKDGVPRFPSWKGLRHDT